MTAKTKEILDLLDATNRQLASECTKLKEAVGELKAASVALKETLDKRERVM